MADKDESKLSEPSLPALGSTTASTKDDSDPLGKIVSTKDDSDQPRRPRGFCDLPQEIRNRILVAACQAGRWNGRDNPVGHSDDCTKTTTTLALVCKDFYRQTLLLLYTSVRLPWPSSLAAFQRTLAARPALGTLIRRLHIGPDESLPRYWWPLEDKHGHGGSEYLRVKLRDWFTDPRQMKYFSSILRLPLAGPEETGDSWEAANQALRAASQGLDIDLKKASFAKSGPRIGSDAWHVRVFELQAAMELWCLDVDSRMEDEQGQHAGDVLSSFPVLAVGGSTATSEPCGRPVFHVTRAQLYARMSRRRAPTDHFGHPILFARSGLRWSARVEHDDIIEWQHQGGSGLREVDDVDDIADAFAWPTSPVREQDQRAPPDLCDLFDQDVPPTMTLGGNLFLARSVLSLTPSVRCLSLTGFLERALVGSRPPCHQMLRFVNLGPPPQGWETPLHLHHSALRSVKRLRICGGPLNRDELAAIAGKDGALASLRRLAWVPTTEHWYPQSCW